MLSIFGYVAFITNMRNIFECSLLNSLGSKSGQLIPCDPKYNPDQIFSESTLRIHIMLYQFMSVYIMLIYQTMEEEGEVSLVFKGHP